jgi:hypothetical protein
MQVSQYPIRQTLIININNDNDDADDDNESNVTYFIHNELTFNVKMNP